MNELREDAFVEAQMPSPVALSLEAINGQSPTMSSGGNMLGLTKEHALRYLRIVRENFKEQRENYGIFLRVMREFNTQRLDTSGVIARVKELFKGYRDLIQGFNAFLPNGYSMNLSPEEENSDTQVEYEEAMQYVNKIKARFEGDIRVFHRFVDLLTMHRDEIKSIPEVYREVTILFKDHQDLLVEFNNFLPKGLEPDSLCYSCSGRSPVKSDKGSASPDMHSMHPSKKIKLRRRLEDSSDCEDGDDNLAVCSTGNSLEKPIVKEDQPELLKAEYNQGIHYYENKGDNKTDIDGNNDTGNHKIPLSITKDVAVPINELDLSSFPQCTPSYRILPKNYPVEIPRHRNEIDNMVLNDHLVSVTSGREDHSFQHRPKKQYEESFFRCEEDRFEMDMLIESVRSAIKHVENLLEKINSNTISKDTPIAIEKHLTIMNQRCIERLYGDYGLEAMEALKKDTRVVLPVILTRLKQKKEEWSRNRSEFRKVWAEVYAKNHQKSLDHRRRYFKQHDSKNFSTKGLVAEIKDISEKKRQEDQLHAIGVGIVPSFIPDLKFNYCDAQIHDDLYELIKYYCEEIYATEQSDKIMELWINFLEPMFGIPSRSQGKLTTEDVSKLEKDNQEQHDECAAMKGNPWNSASTSKCENPSSPQLLNNEHQTVQGSFLGQDVWASIVETFQHDKLHEDAAMTNEVSAGNDQIMEDADNQRVNEASVGQHDNELEEGEISPTKDFEQGNFEVDGEHKGVKNCHGRVSVAGVVANGNEEEDGSFAFSEQILQTVKPVAEHVFLPLQTNETCSHNDSKVFYGNESYYVLFRLHQVLYKRIQSAKELSKEKGKAPDNTTPDSYARFMDALYNLLGDSIDNSKFEDECRAIFGTQSYVLFTLDKLVQKFVKLLHRIAADETEKKLLQLHAYENYRKPGRFIDLVYHENVRALLHKTDIYRIKYSSPETRLSIQLMSSAKDQPKVKSVTVEPSFAHYLQNDFLSSITDEEKHGLFLKRNKRKFTGQDETSGIPLAMEGLKVINEMEYKMDCGSSKVKYVANTADVLYRNKRRKLNSESEISKHKRRSLFHMMLNCRLVASPP